MFDGNIAPDDYDRAGIKSTDPNDSIREEYQHSAGTEKRSTNAEHNGQKYALLPLVLIKSLLVSLIVFMLIGVNRLCIKILRKENSRRNLSCINFKTSPSLVRWFLDWYLGQRTGLWAADKPLGPGQTDCTVQGLVGNLLVLLPPRILKSHEQKDRYASRPRHDAQCTLGYPYPHPSQSSMTTFGALCQWCFPGEGTLSPPI